MPEAFVYCWTDHKENKLYVGSKKGSPTSKYVCSSKLMLEQYYERPNDFSRQVIAEGTFEDMRALEDAILRSVNARRDPQFYNMHNNTKGFTLKGHTKAAREKISKGNKGKKHPKLRAQNLTNNPSKLEHNRKKRSERSKTQINPMLGSKHTEDARRRMSLNSIGNGKGIPKSDEHKQKIKEAAIRNGSAHSERMKNIWAARKQQA